MSSEIQKSAERYRSQQYSTLPSHEEGFDGDQQLSDQVALAKFATELLDQAPLNSLTGEQWRELGFYSGGQAPGHVVWSRYLGIVCVEYCRKHGISICGRSVSGFVALGQMLRLISALEETS